MAFVVDNSIVVAWFVPSQATVYSRRCYKRARREALFAPSLWEAEFANVMLVLVKRGLLPRHQAATVFRHAERLPLSVDREAVPSQRLFDLAERHALSAYDAAYLELARRRALPLATQDSRLERAARKAGMLLA
ncbi:MAG: type II toxin-antitoxin system VapC family toxin [Burkholderiales bacterium]|nr:type II toxin-antitoxin system VapC family toxin [Burkholderiales bacterium]